MHFLYREWLCAWQWLIGENGVRATVLLVFITAWYAWLTYRMARSMNRQTRAQIQPILEIDISVGKEEFHPKGTFSVKNIGTQPSLIRHMRMTCHRDGVEEHEEYRMYEGHLATPQDCLRFNFDFTESLTKRGFGWWTPGIWRAFPGQVAQPPSESLFAAGNPVSQCLKLGVHTSYLVSEAMR